MKSIEDLVKRLKERITEIYSDVEIEDLITKPDVKELDVFTNPFSTISWENEVYEQSELNGLMNFHIPKKVIDFYNLFSPVDTLDIGADVNLLSLEGIKRENTKLTPGALLIKYGVITIASTTGGNAICIDLNQIHEDEPRIIIVDHSIFTDKEIVVFQNGIIEKVQLSYAVINKYAPEVSSTFSDFFEKLLKEEIDDIEEFLN